MPAHPNRLMKGNYETCTDPLNCARVSAQDSTHALTRAPKAGGTAPDTELTLQALAEMSEEKFAEILNELQARGDKTKLMQLFGH
jgi:hypothetical protein